MMLAKETLQEVPSQLLNYFKSKGIEPNPSSETQKAKIKAKMSTTDESILGPSQAMETEFWTE